MKRIISILALSLVATIAQAQQFSDYATVTDVRVLVGESQGNNQQVCRDVPVQRESHSSLNVGTLLGAVVGGVVGNQIGSGTGRTVATAAGAVAGGMVGNSMNQNMNNEPAPGYQRVCENVYGPSQQQVVGYQVTLRYGNRMLNIQTNRPYRRGEQIPIIITIDVAQ